MLVFRVVVLALLAILFGIASSDWTSAALLSLMVGLGVGTLRLVYLDARARGRSGAAWVLIALLPHGAGLVIFTVVAIGDRFRGRDGLWTWRGRSFRDAVGTLVSFAAVVGAIALAVLPVRVDPYDHVERDATGVVVGEFHLRGDCGTAMWVVAGRGSLRGLTPLQGPGLVDEAPSRWVSDFNTEVARVNTECRAEAGQRMTISWMLLVLAGVTAAATVRSRTRTSHAAPTSSSV
jgi:hypothetical protein